MSKWLIISLLFVNVIALSGQVEVFPGDANANGRVDQYDIPYIGYAYGQVGPSRIMQEEVTLAGVPQDWAASFPSGPNFAHADGNGDGVVGLLDFITWSNQFGMEMPPVTPVSLPEVNPASALSVVWNNGEVVAPLTSNESVSIPLHFSIPEGQPVNGLAFRLRYRPSHFQMAQFDAAGNWLTSDGDGIFLQHTAPGIVDVGMTRFGNNPVDGGGAGGVMNLVIITDMVGLLEAAPDTLISWVVLEQLLVVDNTFTPVAVATDSVAVKLYRPGNTTPVEEAAGQALSFQLFPNPSLGDCQLVTSVPFNWIQVVDPLGRVVLQQEVKDVFDFRLPSGQWPPGIYSVRIRNETGDRGSALLVQR
ncbi:MAG: T9SS type A sorting domain-containing protein [Saprospiraceae bacterium]